MIKFVPFTAKVQLTPKEYRLKLADIAAKLVVWRDVEDSITLAERVLDAMLVPHPAVSPGSFSH